MIRQLLTALWVCVVVVVSAYASLAFNPMSAFESQHPSKDDDGLQTVATDRISVPVISDGQLQGYALARFAAIVNATKAKKLGFKVADLIVDEGFAVLYQSEGLSFTDMRKQDLVKLRETIVERANKRLKDDVVNSVLIQELTFVSKAEARR